MEFPMQVPFKLGKIKNSNEWDENTENKFLELVNLINSYAGSKSSKQQLTPLNTILSLTPEFNISYTESLLLPQHVEVKLNLDTYLQKRMYYLIVDSNKSTVEFNSSSVNLLSNYHKSYNRTVYIFRKLDENTVVIYRELKDIYLSDLSDFDTEDFIDWDLTVG